MPASTGQCWFKDPSSAHKKQLSQEVSSYIFGSGLHQKLINKGNIKMFRGVTGPERDFRGLYIVLKILVECCALLPQLSRSCFWASALTRSGFLVVVTALRV